MTFLLLFTTISCWESENSNNGEIQNTGVKDSVTTGKISMNIKNLGKIINLTKYPPEQVEYKYLKLGDENNSRIEVPGPNDYCLEAILYFNHDDITKIKNDYLNLSVNLKPPKNQPFIFDWLSNDFKEMASDYDGIFYQPNFFKKGSLMHGGYIIIDESTILIRLNTM